MATIIRTGPLARPDRDRPLNMTGFVLCALLALPFWAGVLALLIG